MSTNEEVEQEPPPDDVKPIPKLTVPVIVENDDDVDSDEEVAEATSKCVKACLGGCWRFLHALRDLLCCYCTCSDRRAAKHHADRCRMFTAPRQQRLPD